MKKLLLNLLLLSGIAASAHDFAVENADGKTIYYTKSSDTEVAVTYRGTYATAFRNEYSGDITIPSRVIFSDVEYSVTEIGSLAFSDQGYSTCSITSVTIPESVTKIGDSAFLFCDSLKHVSLPSSLTTIGEYAFSNCTGLTDLRIPESVTSIGSKAFCVTGITVANLPSGIQTISNGLYQNCRSLKSVNIPTSVTKIYSNAFAGCSSLQSIEFPPYLESIGSSAFEYCSELTSISIPESLLQIGYYTFRGCPDLKEINITSIAHWATIDIGGNCFSGSYDLLVNGVRQSDVIIPASVETIGANAFCNSTITSVQISEGVKKIGDYAFAECSDLTSVTIPSSIASFGVSPFNNCKNLRQLDYGASSPTTRFNTNDRDNIIRPYPFTGCTSLNEVTLRNSVVSLPKFIFADTPIRILEIPESVQTIATSALYYSSLQEISFLGIPDTYNILPESIRRVTVTSTTPESVTNLRNVSEAILYVPQGTSDLYANLEGWNQFKEIRESAAPGDGGYVFNYENVFFEIISPTEKTCRLTSPAKGLDYSGDFIVPLSVQFDGHTYNVAEVDETTFKCNSTLNSITLNPNIAEFTGIDDSTVNLKAIYSTPDNPYFTSIDGVLYDKNVSQIIFYPTGRGGSYTTPSSLTSIGSELKGKPCVEEIIISDGVKGSIDTSGCPNLKSLKIGDAITRFSVADCLALETLEIGESVGFVTGSMFGAGYHNLWTTTNIRNLIIADSDKPLTIERTSVDDGYICAIPGILDYVYIGRDLKASGSPKWYHFSRRPPHIGLGPLVTEIDSDLAKSLDSSIKIDIPDTDFWASLTISSNFPSVYYLYDSDHNEFPEFVFDDFETASKFRGCYNITTVRLTESVTEIPEKAFMYWTLTSIILPSSITSIGDSAFTCNGLTSITVNNVDPQTIALGNAVFEWVSKTNCTIRVPKGSKELYQSADQWGEFENIVEFEPTIGDIDGDGIVDIKDITTLINVIVSGSNTSSADVNGDGSVNVSDITEVINAITGNI